MTKLRLFVCVTMVLGFVLAVVLFHQLLHLTMLTYSQFILTMIITCIGLLLKEVIKHMLSLKIKDVK